MFIPLYLVYELGVAEVRLVVLDNLLRMTGMSKIILPNAYRFKTLF